jgi:peptide/nickel transport system ATP-binding protein
MSALCTVSGLSVAYRRPLSFAPPAGAVQGVSFTLRPGERVALIGASGCGKTSLVRAVCGLAPRSAGTVSLLGEDPAHLGGPPRGVQLLLQDPVASLNPGLTVRQWLQESARLHRPGDAGAVDQVLDRTGLSHRAEALPNALSGGECRRVTLAALALAAPRVVFADEPTAGLDAARKADALALLLALSGPEAALLLVTHDLLLARHACDRLLFMEAGTLVDDVPAAHPEAARAPAALRLLRSAHLLPPDRP